MENVPGLNVMAPEIKAHPLPAVNSLCRSGASPGTMPERPITGRTVGARDPSVRRALTKSAVCKKFDQKSIHRFRLLFHDGMPGSVHQVNALEPRTCRVHAFK
jgi:hypothetical protein